MFLEGKRSSVKRLLIPIPDLPAAFHSFGIYFVSDVHRRRLSRRMLKKVGEPDLVVIGGDLTERGVPFKRVEENLEKLKCFSCPILFVWGNHDLRVDPYKLREVLKQKGVIILTNEHYSIKKNDQMIHFIGVHDATNGLDCLELPLLHLEGGTRIVLSHNPLVVDRIHLKDRISLVISGHTHGGQIRLFGWGLREKGGVKLLDFGTLIISNGYGTTRYPLRLGAPPDTLYIELWGQVSN